MVWLQNWLFPAWRGYTLLYTYKKNRTENCWHEPGLRNEVICPIQWNDRAPSSLKITGALRVATWTLIKEDITLAWSSGCQFLWIWLLWYSGEVTEERRMTVRRFKYAAQDLTSTGNVYRGLLGWKVLKTTVLDEQIVFSSQGPGR